MDSNGSRGVEANFSDEDALFTLWFPSINLCLPRAGICGDDQGTADKEEAENTSIGGANEPGTSGADVEKDPDTGGADAKEGPGISKADKPGIGGVDVEEDPGTGGADAEEDLGKSGADELGIGGADKPGIDEADKPGTGGADKPGTGGTDKSGIGGADKLSTSKVNKAGGQLARRQAAARASLFSFCKDLFFFFSFLELEICGSLSCSSSSLSSSLITSVKRDDPSSK